MLRVNYKAEALQQIHTGADESHGTTKLLRREKRRLRKPIKFESKFKAEQDRREAILSILLAVYKAIDQDLKASNYGFYDAFASKIISSTGVRTRYEFLTELCKSCGVRTIPDNENLQVMSAIDSFSDEELLQTIRSEHQYLMLMLRHRVKTKGQPSLFDQNIDAPNLVFEKHFDWIPFISGNSVRGVIRRLVMRDFLTRIGVNKETHGVEKDMYHQLMTGGNITGSTAFEDIELREKYIYLCPMIGLLGSAIGNMTIQGRMKTGGLRPVCKEHGDGEVSFWETISREFGTRSDTSKTERDIYIEQVQTADKSANQMKYEFEVFNTGTLFDGDFILVSEDEVLTSAFWYAMKLWKEFGYIGGNSARGYGKMNFQIDIPEGAENAYLEHVENIKEDALAFFAVERKEELNALA